MLMLPICVQTRVRILPVINRGSLFIKKRFAMLQNMKFLISINLLFLKNSLKYISGFDNTTGQNPYSKTHFLQLKGEEINLKCFDIHRFFSSLIKAAAVVATTSIVQNIPMELRFFFWRKKPLFLLDERKKNRVSDGFF